MPKLIDKLKDLRVKIAWAEVAENELTAYKKNANEVEHTSNTGYGKELIPVDVLSDQIYNQIPKYATFLDTLPGFHGNNMWISEKRSIKWEVWFFQGNAEWTTGAGALSQWTNRLATGDVTITQVPMILTVDISKRLQNYSIWNVENFVIESIASSGARTIESMIINWDTVDTATWNVNLDDAQPSATFTGWADDHRLLIDNGLRKLALSWTVNIDYKDVWTLDFNDFIEVRSLMWDYSFDLDQLLLILNGNTYNKTLTIPEFKQQYQNGISSTITDGKLQNKLANVQYVVNRDFPLTEADGKVSVTPTNNTKWGFSYLYKPAVQWGYGQAIEIDTVKIPGKWYQVVATFEVWFTVVNRLAGATSPSTALAINATV